MAIAWGVVVSSWRFQHLKTESISMHFFSRWLFILCLMGSLHCAMADEVPPYRLLIKVRVLTHYVDVSKLYLGVASEDISISQFLMSDNSVMFMLGASQPFELVKSYSGHVFDGFALSQVIPNPYGGGEAVFPVCFFEVKHNKDQKRYQVLVDRLRSTFTCQVNTRDDLTEITIE